MEKATVICIIIWHLVEEETELRENSNELKMLW